MSIDPSQKHEISISNQSETHQPLVLLPDSRDNVKNVPIVENQTKVYNKVEESMNRIDTSGPT